MPQGIRLTELQVDVLYYYHVDSNLKMTKEMSEAYAELIVQVRDYRLNKAKKPKPDKIWEALKGVVG